MAEKGRKTIQLAGFIILFTLTFSAFEYLEIGQLSAADSIEFSGRVTSITDGDTLRIINSQGENQTIRLYGIDAPEYDQPYGSQATHALRQKISNAQIRIIPQDIDDYGRYVSTIYLEERNINLEMVAQGHAWWYEYFAPTNRELEQAQNLARNRNLGLWNSRNPIDPYEWRRTH